MKNGFSRREFSLGLAASLLTLGVSSSAQVASNKTPSASAAKKAKKSVPPERSIEERVKQIIIEQLGVDEKRVVPTANLVKDLDADSLDCVELVMAFEEAFDMEIPDQDAERLKTVQDCIDYIKVHTKVSGKKKRN